MGEPVITNVAVCICTYDRNEPLARLLSRLAAVGRAMPSIELGVAVVDDHPDGNAAPIAARFEREFPLGVRYRKLGSGNISTARNAVIDLGTSMADWLTWLDDDTLPSMQWLEQLVAVQQRTAADVVTGPVHNEAPPGAPAWLTEQPFLAVRTTFADGEQPPTGSTANALWRSQWLIDHPEVRFRHDLGRLGGEDMVFYTTARSAGVVHRYAARALVSEMLPPDRATLRYQMAVYLWLGNTEYVTNVLPGTVSPLRMVLRGCRRLVSAAIRPVQRLVHREPPQLRFSAAVVVQSIGMIIGVFGVRLRHH